MPGPQSTFAQLRSRSAPLALLFALWGLMIGPLAHAVLAHGVPLLRSPGDAGWVQHRPGAPERTQAPALPRGHAHAPGVPDHFRLALRATETVTVAAPVLVRTRQAPIVARRTPTPVRRWAQEQPQGP